MGIDAKMLIRYRGERPTDADMNRWSWDLCRSIGARHFFTSDGVKRWADNGQPLTQELLNSMMREPGEAKRPAAPALPSCPQCGERYCGDGVQLCTECAAPNTTDEPRRSAASDSI